MYSKHFDHIYWIIMLCLLVVCILATFKYKFILISEPYASCHLYANEIDCTILSQGKCSWSTNKFKR